MQEGANSQAKKKATRKVKKKKREKTTKKMYFKIRFGHAIGKTKTYGLIMFESRTGFI